jgi:hypothetical protein
MSKYFIFFHHNYITHFLFVSPYDQRDERVERSVNRMMTIIDLARNIRERHSKALKTPLKYVWTLIQFFSTAIFLFRAT